MSEHQIYSVIFSYFFDNYNFQVTQKFLEMLNQIFEFAAKNTWLSICSKKKFVRNEIDCVGSQFTSNQCEFSRYEIVNQILWLFLLSFQNSTNYTVHFRTQVPTSRNAPGCRQNPWGPSLPGMKADDCFWCRNRLQI